MVTNGDVPAVVTTDFESFYAQTGRAMLVMARAVTGSWSDAEDLVQEAYAAAHRRWHVIGAYDDPAAWVRRVIANRAVSRWRRLGRELDVRERLAARREPRPNDVEPVDAAFWDAVRALPRQQQAVVALFYVEDLPVDAIATLLGCAAGTVKTQLFRARRTLAARLGARLEEDRDA